MLVGGCIKRKGLAKLIKSSLAAADRHCVQTDKLSCYMLYSNHIQSRYHGQFTLHSGLPHNAVSVYLVILTLFKPLRRILQLWVILFWPNTLEHSAEYGKQNDSIFRCMVVKLFTHGNSIISVTHSYICSNGP